MKIPVQLSGAFGRTPRHEGLTNNAWTENYTLHTQLFGSFDNGAVSLDRAVHLSCHSFLLVAIGMCPN